MDFPIQIKAVRMRLSIKYLKGHRSLSPNYVTFLSPGIVFTITNSVDSDEMLHCVAFHLSLHCLSKFPVYTRL